MYWGFGRESKISPPSQIGFQLATHDSWETKPSSRLSYMHYFASILVNIHWTAISTELKTLYEPLLIITTLIIMFKASNLHFQMMTIHVNFQANIYRTILLKCPIVNTHQIWSAVTLSTGIECYSTTAVSLSVCLMSALRVSTSVLFIYQYCI